MERTRLKWIEEINEYCNDLKQKVYSDYLNVYIVSIEGVGFRFMEIHDLITALRPSACMCIHRRKSSGACVS